MAIVGSSVVVGKLALERFPIFLLSGLRFTVAALILMPMVLAAGRGAPRLGRRDLGVGEPGGDGVIGPPHYRPACPRPRFRRVLE